MLSSFRPWSDTGAPPARTARDSRIAWHNICCGKCLLRGWLSSSAFQSAEGKGRNFRLELLRLICGETTDTPWTTSYYVLLLGGLRAMLLSECPLVRAGQMPIRKGLGVKYSCLRRGGQAKRLQASSNFTVQQRDFNTKMRDQVRHNHYKRPCWKKQQLARDYPEKLGTSPGGGSFGVDAFFSKSVLT